jgi:DNA-binding response OmpR family regulator
MKQLDPGVKFNLSSAIVLVVDRSTHSSDVIVQILSGFGVHKILRAQTAKRAEEILGVNAVDLMLIDPELEEEDGFEFIREIRRSKSENRFAPIILISGHAKISSIKRARDCGANFFIAKPLTPTVVLQRIHWVASDKRQFVDVADGSYVGPDRRFKFEGPPPGSDGRRESDLPMELGGQAGENLSQSELETMFKPQKVSI